MSDEELKREAEALANRLLGMLHHHHDCAAILAALRHVRDTATVAERQRCEQRIAAQEAREQSGLMSALGDFLTAKRHEHEAWLAAWDAEWRLQQQSIVLRVAQEGNWGSLRLLNEQSALLERAEAALAGVLTIANVATDEADVARSVIAAIREQREVQP